MTMRFMDAEHLMLPLTEGEASVLEDVVEHALEAYEKALVRMSAMELIDLKTLLEKVKNL